MQTQYVGDLEHGSEEQAVPMAPADARPSASHMPPSMAPAEARPSSFPMAPPDARPPSESPSSSFPMAPADARPPASPTGTLLFALCLQTLCILFTKTCTRLA